MSSELPRRLRERVAGLLARAAGRLGSEADTGDRAFAGPDKQTQLDEVERMAAIGSWSADLLLSRTTWSDEFFRICGYEPQAFEPGYEQYLATIHPDDRAAVMAIVEQAVKDHQPYSHEYRVVRPDGSERFCQAHGTVFTNSAGAVVRLAGTCQDITERKAAEKELTLHQEQLEEAQQIAMLGSWNWDLYDGVITWSDELSRIFGHEPTGFPYDFQGSMQAVHPDDRDRVQAIVDQVMVDHKPVSYEFRVVRPDADVRFCQARISVFTDGAGTPVRMAGVVQDVTDRKAMEEELLRATTARAAAEGANVAKGKFLASMSHELRTPLNSVIGFANVLLKNKAGNLESKDIKYLERIRDNGKHLLELINEILDLSKVEVGKMEVEAERFSLGDLVTETLDGLRGAVGENINLRVILPDSMTPIVSDPRKLKQILINLVGNAIKFTEKGEVTVEVFADPVTRRPERIEVRDTGVGIPRDRLDAVFVAFEQADGGTGRRFGGTGLGLAIVASLSELLGFRIEVESELGVGSTFRLTLPPEPSERTDREDGTRPAKASDRVAARQRTGEMELRNRLVLVIDDETDSRILLTDDLEEAGARTIAASSGEQGIRMAREFHPDIIALDLLLPGKSGWQTLSALKSDPDLRDIPVVIVSVIGRENCGSLAGAAEVIDKPINRDELVATLRRTLNDDPQRILIVDDTPDSRVLLSSYLEDEGAEIRTAGDGIEALRIIDEFEPDLVLLDLVMPNLDGVALIRKLNEREPYMSIPIVVITSKELTGEEEESLSLSSLAVLRKGAGLEQDLREALKKIL